MTDGKKGAEVEFESLIGERVLDAVDTSTEQVKKWGDHFENANVMRFRLDGKVYTAVEDPDDGYRSGLERLYAADEPISNVFPPCKVLVRRKRDDNYGKNDTLEMIDMVTGKVVLEVGTDNCDDYYPSFVANFTPENMAINDK